MGLNRFAQRRDANHSEFVKLARSLGAQIEIALPLDLWCGWKGQWFPVEIKRPDGPKGGRKGRKYTNDQLLFFARCNAHGNPHHTWRTEDDVLQSLGARRTA